MPDFSVTLFALVLYLMLPHMFVAITCFLLLKNDTKILFLSHIFKEDYLFIKILNWLVPPLGVPVLAVSLETFDQI